MSPLEQLARIQVELEEAHRRAHEIVAPLKNEGWGARAAPDQWSVAECDLGKLRIVSPFDPRIKYNLYSCLRLILAHQRLHLRQAEQFVHKVRSTRAG